MAASTGLSRRQQWREIRDPIRWKARSAAKDLKGARQTHLGLDHFEILAHLHLDDACRPPQRDQANKSCSRMRSSIGDRSDVVSHNLWKESQKASP